MPISAVDPNRVRLEREFRRRGRQGGSGASPYAVGG